MTPVERPRSSSCPLTNLCSPTARTIAFPPGLGKAVSKRLVEFVGNSQFQLVETLAEKVAEILLAEFKLQWVRVRINKKGAVRGATDVGVVIERGKA